MPLDDTSIRPDPDMGGSSQSLHVYKLVLSDRTSLRLVLLCQYQASTLTTPHSTDSAVAPR
jgi:hypothetical protein